MSKTSFLIFAAGAAAGWTAAQRLARETESWAAASSQPIDKEQAPTDVWDSRPESPPARPAATGGDPFRGAFAGALAEVDADNDDPAEPETSVA